MFETEKQKEEKAKILNEILETKFLAKKKAQEKMDSLLKKQTKKIGITHIMITDDEINEKDYKKITKFFKRMEQTWRVNKEKVMLVIDGYNHTTVELWQIKEVKDYFHSFFVENPHTLYFLNKKLESFQLAIMFIADEISTMSKYVENKQTFYEKINEQKDNLKDFELNIEKDLKSYISINGKTISDVYLKIISYFENKNEIDIGLELINEIEEVSKMK